MKCKNCGHKLEEAKSKLMQEFGAKYYHVRNQHENGWLGFKIKKTIKHFELCHCGCTKPEPTEMEERKEE